MSWGGHVQSPSTDDRPKALTDDVEEAADEADLARDEETKSDGRVDVTSADMRNCPYDSSDAEAECQGYLDCALGWTCGTGTAAERHKQIRADELS